MSTPIAWEYSPHSRRMTDRDFAVSMVRAGIWGIRERGIKLAEAFQIAAARYGISQRKVRQIYEADDAFRVTRQEIGWLRAGQAALARSTAAWHRRRADYWMRVAEIEEAGGRQMTLALAEEANRCRKPTTKPSDPTEYEYSSAA